MKTKEINGNIYSLEQFTTYELRIMFNMLDIDGFEHSITIFTDCKQLNKALVDVTSIKTDKVVFVNIIEHFTKEQDEQTTKLINEHFESL